MKTNKLYYSQKGIKVNKQKTAKEELKKLTWAYDLREKIKPLLKDTKMFHPTETKKEFLKRVKEESYI